VKKAARARSILHIDLDPFIVSVERSFDPSLRGKPVVVGGPAGGIVAAASAEARAKGVKTGLSLHEARRRCPDAIFRAGDLETYARISEEVTKVLLSASRRVERPSADEAYIDLTPEAADAPLPVPAAERIKDELQRRLKLDVSLGLGSSRLAARVASTWARPRGLLVVLPGYEARFLAGQKIQALDDLPPHLEHALLDAGLPTIGDVADADLTFLTSVVGSPAAHRLREAARGLGEEPIEVAAPPLWISEETHIRDARTDGAALLEVAGALAGRAARRLRPFDLVAGMLSVEVRRKDRADRRSSAPGVLTEEAEIQHTAQRLVQDLIEPARGVRTIEVRLTRLRRRTSQEPLFPGWTSLPHVRRAL
jgi:DNA polymerase-4